MTTLRDVALVRAQALVHASEDAGVVLRLLGGVAIAIRCPSAGAIPALERDFSDVDAIICPTSAKVVKRLVPTLGYDADERFNTITATPACCSRIPTVASTLMSSWVSSECAIDSMSGLVLSATC